MRTLVAFVTLLFTLHTPLFAAKADIVDIQIKEKYSQILVSVKLKGNFTEKIEEAFMSGMPVTFTYRLNLIRTRPVFWDATENSIKVHKIVKYDSFAKEFNAIEMIADKAPKPKDFEKELEAIKNSNRSTIFSEEKSVEKNPEWRRYLVLKDLPAMEMWLKQLKDIPLGEKTEYPSQRKYYVEVKAEMDNIKLPAPLNYILFFVSFMDFDTAWETSSPFMIEEPVVPIKTMVGKQENK